MKTFTIVIEASDLGGVMRSLQEVSRELKEGYLSGIDSNDTENYSFESEGSYGEEK